jgi:hypothetical protein
LREARFAELGLVTALLFAAFGTLRPVAPFPTEALFFFLELA